MHSQAERLNSLSERLARLTDLQFSEVERLVSRLVDQVPSSAGQGIGRTLDWPHSPIHRLSGKGTFLVTAGTLGKRHHFKASEDLDLLQTELLSKAAQYGWQIEAWACFSNHYHFVGHALADASTLEPLIVHLHSDTAREINVRHNKAGRHVWHNYWDTELTYETSYLARLSYVHQNPVHHRLVPVANQYRWCSACWFERTATPAQVKTIYGFKTDKLKVLDDFDVALD